ncbi:GNAT family N-acetyltransferase [Oceanobacillus sp. CAU 1775]
MKIMSVKQAVYKELQDYLDRNEYISKNVLLENGYVVEISGKIEGSFVLEEIDEATLWLKQLYITQAQAAKLPALLETILQLARKRNAKSVYVHSHQPVVDILLEALKFQVTENKLSIPTKPSASGSWWSYHVS